MCSRAATIRLSDAEWSVMNVVWRQNPISAREILEEIQESTGWAYTTVKTILSRLVDKGVLHVGKRANTSIYEPLITRKNARREALHSLLDKAFEGTFGSLLQHMIAEEKLSKRDREKLAAMIEASKKKGGRKR